MNLTKNQIIERVQYYFDNIKNNTDINEAVLIYLSYYSNVIKSAENKTSCEDYFEIIDSIFEKELEKFSFSNTEDFQNNSNHRKVIFYMPNINNPLAHINFLTALLDKYTDNTVEINIASSFIDYESIDNDLKELQKKKIINRIIKCDIASTKDINKIIINEKFDYFIVWGIPLILPLWLHLFKEKVIFVTTKYEYSCFRNLKNAFSFQSFLHVPTKKQTKNTLWHKLPPFLPNLNFPIHTKKINRNKIKLISVNRIEKINDLDFIDTVIEILKAIPEAHFYYCGRKDNQEFVDYFKRNNVDSKIHFLGWVNPFDIVNNYDIFLDSFTLSGILAANYFISGLPVVTFSSSISYINLHHIKMEKVLNSIFSFKTKKEYITYTIKLVDNELFYDEVKRKQKLYKDSMLEINNDLANVFMKKIYEINSI